MTTTTRNTPSCIILPSLETRRKWVPRIYDAHKGSAVLFGVHKHNERDNFMSPYAGFLCIYTPQSKKTKKMSHSKLAAPWGQGNTHACEIFDTQRQCKQT